MKTELLHIDPLNPEHDKIVHAANVIREGGIVAFPTETVYGLGANMNSISAVEKLYQIKDRSVQKPSSILVAKQDYVDQFISSISPKARKLMHFYWPGPLTLIFAARDGKTLGFRCPRHRIALDFIREANVPILAPSANRAGENPAVNAQEVVDVFDGIIDLVIDSGTSKYGVASTIVDFSKDIPEIVREGAVSSDDVENTCMRKVVLFVCTGNTCRSFMAEYIFNSLIPKDANMQALSCGISTMGGQEGSQTAVKVLLEEGIEVSKHYSQQSTPYLIKMADVVLVMDEFHKNEIIRTVPEVRAKIFLLKEYKQQNELAILERNIADPIGQEKSVYRACFQEIQNEIKRIMPFL